MTEFRARSFQIEVERVYRDAQFAYELALKNGVPKELARLVLPVGRYSRMRASANLRNWLAFLTLRLDPAAQQEIRWYAGAVDKVIEAEFPRTWKLFHDQA
jgi:thymidylate synthase (FAD)